MSLASAKDASIDANVTSHARKRTRDEVEEGCAIDRRPFTIQPDSSDPFAKPRTFTPLCLLSRSKLPLAYLDTAQDGSRMFTAHVQILETCVEHQDEANVLIVEDEQESRLYAIERVKRRQYALCRLSEWVKKEAVVEREAVDLRQCEPQMKRQAVQPIEDGKPWWMAATVDVNVEKMLPVKSKMPVLSMLKSQDPISASNTATNNTDVPVSGTETQTHHDDTIGSKPTPVQDPLEELAKQYLDALYLSRTPVAYFVKGPLARARAAFASQPAELISFLRTTILSAPVTDKKYRESVAEFIKELPILDTPEKKSKKKKRKWKPKRDKYGFFVDEKDHLEQWWRGDDETGSILGSAETMDAAIRRRSQRLKSRETFLQTVLILETMALETTAAKSPAPTPAPVQEQSQAQETQGEESQAAGVEKKPRKKKELDIAALLDTLLDRLCIWYSIDSGSPAKSMTEANKEESNDDLKTFASEVIIPFFAARIYEQANAGSKKLGGPTAPNPNKKTAAPRKPGEPALRQPPAKKPRKPLERVSTDTLNRAGKRAPTLQRSATDSDVLEPLIKREISETPPLDSIPFSKHRANQKSQQTGPKKRSSLLESLTRREVDLSAMSQANEAKLRRKREVEDKVREAINNVKKPNRARAVEDIAKNADESFAKAISKSSNGKNSYAQKKTAEKSSIAVSATPRHIRATPAPKRRAQERGSEQSYGTQTSMVPASSLRPLAQPPSSAFAVPQTGHRPRTTNLIEDTPSRGFAKFMPTALTRQPGTLLESPTASRSSQVAATPKGKVPKMGSLVEASPMRMVQATPMARTSLKGRTYSPIKKPALHAWVEEEEEGKANEGQTSIYDALGWNDDDYEELA